MARDTSIHKGIIVSPDKILAFLLKQDDLYARCKELSEKGPIVPPEDIWDEKLEEYVPDPNAKEQRDEPLMSLAGIRDEDTFREWWKLVTVDQASQTFGCYNNDEEDEEGIALSHLLYDRIPTYAVEYFGDRDDTEMVFEYGEVLEGEGDLRFVFAEDTCFEHSLTKDGKFVANLIGEGSDADEDEYYKYLGIRDNLKTWLTITY